MKKITLKKNNRSIAAFFMYIRFAVIISTVMIFCIAISAKSADMVIYEIVNLLSGGPNDMYYFFSYFYIFLMFVFIFSTFLFLAFFLVAHSFSVTRRHSISLSKFEILGLIQYLIFGSTFLILLFVGFTSWNWVNELDENELLVYLIPSLDLAVILPTLILNILGLVQHIWDHYAATHNSSSGNKKYDTQWHVAIPIITMVTLVFVLYFWGLPELLIEDVGIAFKQFEPMKVIQYINMYLTIIFVIAVFFLLVIYYSLRVRKERLKKVSTMTNVETALCIFSIAVTMIFLVSTSVITMWASADKERETCLGIGIINSLFVLPAFALNVLYYSINMKKVAVDV